MYCQAYGSAQFGLVLAVVFIVFSFFLTLLSHNVLALLALESKALSPTKRISFTSMLSMILPRFSWVLDAGVLVQCGGARVSYLSNASNLFAQGFYSIRRWDVASFSLRNTSLVIGAALLACPLCLMKQLGSTKLPSIFVLACIFYILIVTMFLTHLVRLPNLKWRSSSGPQDFFRFLPAFLR